MIITIDGPSASGKSSLARALAQRYNLHHLATGLLYRAVGFVLSRAWKNENVEPRWQALTDDDYSMIKNIQYRVNGNKANILYKSEDISLFLAEEKIADFASQVSEDPKIRQLLLSVQRDVAKKQDVVADGRDCGSILFPDANIKLYITASIQARARRMFDDLDRWKDQSKNYDQIIVDLQERDERDMNRAVAPLVIPEGALVVDTTKIIKQQVFEHLFEYVDQHISQKK